MSDNLIETLVPNIFSTNIELKYLNMKNNLIIDILYDFGVNIKLVYLYLGGNPLPGLQRSAFESIMFKRPTELIMLKMELNLTNFTCDCTQLWLTNHKHSYLHVYNLDGKCGPKGLPSLSEMNILCLIDIDNCDDFNRTNGIREAQMFCGSKDIGLYIYIYIYIYTYINISKYIV